MMKRALIVVIAGLAAGCASVAPPPDYAAPPTEQDFMYIGGDAYDSYFLTTWRSCTQYNSKTACRNQIYGGYSDCT